MLNRLIVRTGIRFRVRNLKCRYATNSTEPQVQKYVFREVRSDSIIKDFAMGLISPQLLKFPEEKHPNESVPKLLAQLDSLTGITETSSKIDYLKKIGLFGTIIPEKYGGLGLSMTNYAYLMQHKNLVDWSLSLIAHQSLCVQAIMQYGSEEQQTRYLPRLATGEMVGAFCLTENCSGSDMMAIETVGVLTALEDFYVVTGTKNWVVNGALADLMVVFVLTQDSRYEGGRDYLTALMVERTSEGVSVSQEYDVKCLSNSYLADVSFNSVFVPIEKVLFEDHGGYKIANFVQNNARCMVGACIAGILRLLVEDLDGRDRTGAFENNSHIRDLVNDCVCYLYAVESGLFFTTRFADQYEVPEIELESAAIKVFSIDSAKIVVDNYKRILDLIGCPLPDNMSVLCDRVNYLQSFLGSNYFVRLYIGGTMAQLSEFSFLEVQERLKSPIENFSWLTKTAKNVNRLVNWNEKAEDSRYSSKIDRTMFIKDIKSMYRSIQLSRISLGGALKRYQEGTLDRQFIIEAMSHIGTLVYVLSCCVAHANTNYGDFELSCTQQMMARTREVLEENVESLTRATVMEDFSFLPLLCEDIKKSGGYHAADVLSLRTDKPPPVADPNDSFYRPYRG